MEELKRENTFQAEARIENFRELLSVAKQFAADDIDNSLENFLSHVALVTDVDTADLSGDAVTLITLHSAKGLEFPLVFMAGMEEGIFPHMRALINESEIEEERRLCYVGITRAQRRLFVSSATCRTIYGKTSINSPSRFLEEIPNELVKEQVSSNKRADQIFSAARPDVRPQVNRENIMPPNAGNPAITDWKAGDRVQHGKWGTGTVVEVRGWGEDQEVKVAFPGMGIRQLAVKFAYLTRL